MNKTISVLIVIALLAGGAYYFLKKDNPSELPQAQNEEQATDTKTMVAPGAYTVDTTLSTIAWSVGKPLIEGYINSGTISLKEGAISVADTSASGSFTIDMNTIKVGATPKKPGQESALEGHLKGKNFFEVDKYPTGAFSIDSVVKHADSDTTHVYDVTGSLTLKGKKNSITFPAEIYLEGGKLHAHGTLEVDRTKWGITYGSGSFFDNLANNAIEDTIHLTLSIIASPAEVQ